MHRHKDIRLLVNMLTAGEKEGYLQHPHAIITPPHVKLLTTYPFISSDEAARQLGLSDKRYKTICEKGYADLCSFLLSGRQASDVESGLQHTQQLAELLKERGLFRNAQEKMMDAIAIAEYNELYGRELLLQHQYLQIITYTQLPADSTLLTPTLQRINWLVEELVVLERLRSIYDQLVALRYKLALRTLPAEQQEINGMQEQLQHHRPETLRSNTAHIYYYLSALLADFMLGKTENFSEYNISLLCNWQQHSHLIPLHPELFVRSLSGQAYTHFLAKDIAAAQTYLEQYCTLADKYLLNSFYKKWFAVVTFHTRLKVLHKTFRYPQLASYFSAEWPKVYIHLPVLREVEKLDLIVSSCITHFVLQQWLQAEDLLLEAKQTNYKLKRTDTLYFTFVFHCLILFEQKEWSRLNNLINTEYHFLYSNNTLRPFERDMLLFIKKMPLMMLQERGKEGMKAFLQKLDTYRKDDAQKLYFAYFDFYSWIESKVEGISYTDHVTQKAMRKETA